MGHEPSAEHPDGPVVDTLLGALTLEEKATLVVGSDMWHTAAVPRLGIGSIRMTDGPAGARGTAFEGIVTSTLVPSGAALGATFDPDVVERIGIILGKEAKAKGAHVLLAPTINLVRHPLGGRGFECFGEDPDLTADLAAALVRGVQSQGVAACPKHLVANEQETSRMTISAEVDESTLRAVYLRPFHAAMVSAGAWTCMAAYNRLNGVHCSEHPWLLTTVLRSEWGWDGVVLSDWTAVHSTAASLAAGCDLEMPGPVGHRGPALVDAIERGEVDAAELDSAVRRILLLAQRVGVLGSPGAAPVPGPERPTGTDPDVRRFLREVTSAATVVLHDQAGILPLAMDATVLVTGAHADRLHAGGGGSASLWAPHAASLVEALEALGVPVVHEPGCRPHRPPPFDPARTSTVITELDASGAVVAERTVGWSRWISFGAVVPPAAAIVTLDHTAAVDGCHTLRVIAFASVEVTVDDVIVLANDVAGTMDLPIDLTGGRTHRIVVKVIPAPGAAFVDLRLDRPSDPDILGDAAAAAAAASAAVVVVGLDGEDDTEMRDRTRFDLPEEQLALVRATVAVQPRTIVVVNAGSPVDLSWAAEVPCLLFLPPPGQEGGHGLADVLLGIRRPTGRLPFTIPERLVDSGAHANFPGDGSSVRYEEGELVGHRWFEARGIAPRYAFGHPGTGNLREAGASAP